jgi:hypothetical protein
VFARISDHPVKRVHELLPWNLEGCVTGWMSVTPPEWRAKQTASQTYRVTGRMLTDAQPSNDVPDPQRDQHSLDEVRPDVSFRVGERVLTGPE